jgi:hypothetical protein
MEVGKGPNWSCNAKGKKILVEVSFLAYSQRKVAKIRLFASLYPSVCLPACSIF